MGSRISYAEQLLERLCGQVDSLAATALRNERDSKILWSGTRVFDSHGQIHESMNVPYAAVLVVSASALPVTVTNAAPAASAPTQGRGVAIVDPFGTAVLNAAGRDLTLYGNPGDAVTLVVTAQSQPFAGASGSVLAYTPPTVDLYTEAPTGRLTNGNTNPFTLPETATVAFVGVNVTAYTGGTGLGIYFEQQDANGVWQIIATANYTGSGAGNFSVGPGTQNNQILRAGAPCRIAWNLNGAFTALSFQLAVSVR